MAKRKPMPPKKDKKIFTKTALKVHPKNNTPQPQRGGTRF